MQPSLWEQQQGRGRLPLNLLLQNPLDRYYLQTYQTKGRGRLPLNLDVWRLLG